MLTIGPINVLFYDYYNRKHCEHCEQRLETSETKVEEVFFQIGNKTKGIIAAVSCIVFSEGVMVFVQSGKPCVAVGTFRPSD